MRIRVYYFGGKVLDFVVSHEILMVDFTEMAAAEGTIRKVDFP